MDISYFRRFYFYFILFLEERGEKALASNVLVRALHVYTFISLMNAAVRQSLLLDCCVVYVYLMLMH